MSAKLGWKDIKITNQSLWQKPNSYFSFRCPGWYLKMLVPFRLDWSVLKNTCTGSAGMVVKQKYLYMFGWTGRYPKILLPDWLDKRRKASHSNFLAEPHSPYFLVRATSESFIICLHYIYINAGPPFLTTNFPKTYHLRY